MVRIQYEDGKVFSVVTTDSEEWQAVISGEDFVDCKGDKTVKALVDTIVDLRGSKEALDI